LRNLRMLRLKVSSFIVVSAAAAVRVARAPPPEDLR